MAITPPWVDAGWRGKQPWSDWLVPYHDIMPNVALAFVGAELEPLRPDEDELVRITIPGRFMDHPFHPVYSHRRRLDQITLSIYSFRQIEYQFTVNRDTPFPPSEYAVFWEVADICMDKALDMRLDNLLS